ncbi:MAG: ribonuclease III [Lachnospiraceae bacterium]|nr:ribonuclease III [Lachnospiraceae bacterium]
MEQGLSTRIREYFSIEEQDIRQYSPLTLAFIGDAVYEVIIRSIVVDKGNTVPGKLHGHSAHLVKAVSQKLMIEAVEDDLDEEETDIYRRGRNAKSYSKAKNASVHDYRIATGFEALIGYLYLKDRMERILELVYTGLERTGLEK